MSYAVIENTPGYLPENDDPPVFDQYAEAFNYLMQYRQEIEAADWAYDFDGDAEELMLDFTDGLQDGWFEYTDRRKIHDLGRVVEIVPVEELCPTCGKPDNCGDCTHEGDEE